MDSCGVMPSVSPTVATADAVSNIQVSSGRLSTRLIVSEPAIKSVPYIVKIARAFLVTSLSILLPSIALSGFFFSTDTAVDSITDTVEIFIPPAVEPELPPIIISRMVIIIVASLNLVISTVLKPAVLGVTARKNAAKNLSPPLIYAHCGAANSTKKKYTNGTVTSTSVPISAIFDCRRYLANCSLFFVRSSQVAKPKAPTIISIAVTTAIKPLVS